MRSLAAGEKDFEKARKLMADNFVFLNIYCKSVEDEHLPRGPEGPFQFTDKSVPVYLIKSFEGETFCQNLGFVADKTAGMRAVLRDIEKALKDNGPVLLPKSLRPLKKDFEKGVEYLKKSRPGYAYVEFKKVVDAAADESKFPGGTPSVAIKAEAELKKIVDEAEKEVREAEAAEDPKEAKKLYRNILRVYGKVPPIAEKVRLALKDL